jgi:hypothetical protein
LGEVIAIDRGTATCPVKAVKAWMAAAGISEGALFRPVAKGGRLQATRLSDRSVADMAESLPWHTAEILDSVSRAVPPIEHEADIPT